VIRVVIDTNVIVSGLLQPNGNEALVLLAVAHGLLQPCFSNDIIDEYAAVLAQPKFSFAPDDTVSFPALMHDRGEAVRTEALTDLTSPDPGDTKFLLCAMAAKAEYIVTGNKRDFLHIHDDLFQVVTARELLDRITLEM
jgi:uncharacterized protein